MKRAIMAGLVVLGLCAPARACEFSAADFRTIFDRTIAQRAGLAPVSEYYCQQENGAASCSMVTPSTVEFSVADAPDVHRASSITMGFQHPPSHAALEVIYSSLAALCSPEVPETDRSAALARAEAQPASYPDGIQVIIGEVSYRFMGGGTIRIKDRRLANTRGINTSDDE